MVLYLACRILSWGAGKKKAGKKGGGKGKGGGQPSPTPSKPNSKALAHADAAHCAALSVNALTAKILEWQPDMDGAGMV